MYIIPSSFFAPKVDLLFPIDYCSPSREGTRPKVQSRPDWANDEETQLNRSIESGQIFDLAFTRRGPHCAICAPEWVPGRSLIKFPLFFFFCLFSLSPYEHGHPFPLIHSMTTEPQTSTLRRRGGDAAETTDLATAKNEKPTTRTPQELMGLFPDLKPILPSTTEADPSLERTTTSATTSTLPSSASSSARSVGGTVLYYLAKPFSFLVFVLIHLSLELMTSARTMKTMVQVFFLPHLFPGAPELVRILRKDLGQGSNNNSDSSDNGTKVSSSSPAPLLAKLPKHLAVILPANSTSEDEEEEWHATVAQLAQWSVASGIKCLSIMRTDRKNKKPGFI